MPSTHLDKLKRKICTPAGLKIVVEQLKNENKIIVFTNGCFDILHLGHIDYLAKAADLGNILVVGLNSDVSVKKIKAAGRPIQDEKSRLMQIAALSFVDAVILFDDETPFNLINELKPHILVKGGDYRENDVVGADVVKKNGGKVVILPFVTGYSTTAIEQKIIENYKKDS